MSKVIFPAEWDRDVAIMIAWPHPGTDWAYMLDEVCSCYTNMVKAFVDKGLRVIIAAPCADYVKTRLKEVDCSNIIFFEVDTNDTWTRDYGPITIEMDGKPRVQDFKFNGWGLKFAACNDNLVTLRMCERKLITAPRDNRLGFVFEGGSIESDGNGTLMTTARCLESPNRNGDLTRAQIESRLKEWLGARKILWVEHGELEGDDTDSHIDTLARLAPGNTIIYTGCYDKTDPHAQELDAMKRELMEFTNADGEPFNLAELPLPAPIHDEDGNRLPATYANYLVTPQAVFMPTYSQPLLDMTAKGVLAAVFGREVVEIDCTALIKQHGSLHCATMQIPNDILCL